MPFFESVLSAASRMKFRPMSSWLDLRVGWRIPNEIKKHNKLYLLKTANPPSSFALNNKSHYSLCSTKYPKIHPG
jgi:hypothetical protein